MARAEMPIVKSTSGKILSILQVDVVPSGIEVRPPFGKCHLLHSPHPREPKPLLQDVESDEQSLSVLPIFQVVALQGAN